MTPIETHISEYLEWMKIHNYAKTTISCRERYLSYLTCFLATRGIDRCDDVTLEDLLAYQHVASGRNCRGSASMTSVTSPPPCSPPPVPVRRRS
jgi:site-specific recombinase XerD